MSAPIHAVELWRLAGPSTEVQSQAVLQQLEAVLGSPEFANSRRCSEFLRHIVEHALAGDVASLRGRTLGVEVFGRRDDYDTGSDAIVRVSANDLRRRLALFYRNHPDQPVYIRLPLGSYVPALDTRAAAPVPQAEATRANLGLLAS